MRTFITNLTILRMLGAAFCPALTGQLAAQTFTTLYSFSGGRDGAYPDARLMLSASTLYGTAFCGGDSASGTVFKVNTDGTGFMPLYSFTPISAPFSGSNSDGAFPESGLISSNNVLYGTAFGGGGSGNGTVFKLNTDGTGFTTLHNFTTSSGTLNANSDGKNPDAGLILSGSTLFGTAANGGEAGAGTVFAVNIDGTGFTTLHRFAAGNLNPNNLYTNSDGANPFAELVLSGHTLFGTASLGGSSGNGTIFRINTDGTGFVTLYSFTAKSGFSPYTNGDGANPTGGLLLSGNVCYGTAGLGGSSGNGTVFKINTDGTGFTTLHSFSATSVSAPHTNADGAYPRTALILSGSTLAGTAGAGGDSGNGTIFTLNVDGTGFKTLHSFSETACNPCPNDDGAYPLGALIFSENTLYGTTDHGGSSASGTIFTITLPVSLPELTINASRPNVILTWPTNATGFNLLSTTNLVLPVWFTNSVSPSVINGQYTVTNPIVGAQQFYRLSQ
jgi:uncharacterized repeat protein (TIGR03803 family)